MADTKLSELTELDATPAVGDEVYIRDVSEAAATESKRITIANLLAGAGAAKEIFIPIFGGKDVTARGALIDGAGEHAYLSLLVPQDFTAITSIEIIFNPLGTGEDMRFVVTTYYGAYNGTEDYNVHTETDANRDIGATVTNQNLAHSISDLVDVAALAKGDLLLVDVGYAGFEITSNGYVVGIRLKYS